MANLQGGGQVALKRLRGLTVDQLAEQIVAVPGQLAIILLHGINAQGKRIIQIVLWSSFFGHADQMVGLCTGGQLGGRAGQRFVLCG